MKKEHEQNAAGGEDAARPPGLIARLTRRLTAPGLVDVRQPRRQYERTALWAAGRHAQLERMLSRRTAGSDSSETDDRHAPGQMLLRGAARGAPVAPTFDTPLSGAEPTFARAAAEEARPTPVSAEPPPSGKLRVRRKRAQQTPGGGPAPGAFARPAAAPHAEASPVTGGAETSVPAGTSRELPATPRESHDPAHADPIAPPLRQARADDANLILPKRQAGRAGVAEGGQVAATFPTQPKSEATSAPRLSAEGAAARRVSSDESLADEIGGYEIGGATEIPGGSSSHGLTASTALDLAGGARGGRVGDRDLARADDRMTAVASELRVQSPLAQPPASVWRKGPRMSAANAAGPVGAGAGAQAAGPRPGAGVRDTRAATETPVAQAGASPVASEARTVSASDAARIADQVMRDISRRLLIERERRGLGN